MTCCLPLQTVARTILLLAGIVLGLVLLSGCDAESYSEDLRYPARSDPLVVDPLETTTGWPDVPGQLPLLSLSDLAESKHPLFEEPGKANKILDPNTVNAQQRERLRNSLEKTFGTPAHPQVKGIETGATSVLKLEADTLAEGSKLYRRHCLHCHGLTGDGRGPTAPWVNPHPRDYRQGKFKFTSTNLGLGVRKARRDDLLRTLRQGIEGTSMPSFGLLSENELDALVSYVIYLSLRGEIEYTVLTGLIRDAGEVINPDTGSKMTLENLVAFWLRDLTITTKDLPPKNWIAAQDPNNLIVPDPYPYDPNNIEQMRASVRRGWELFKSATPTPDPKAPAGASAGCIGCHEDYGRKVRFSVDSWGTLVRRTDLTLGIYRGGRRPIDLYWRIYAGINGSGMASFDQVLRPDEKQQARKEHPLWDVVNFLQALPYPGMREEYGIDIDEPVQ